MAVTGNASCDIRTAVELANQAHEEDKKQQFANAIRLYRRAMESFLNAALLIRNSCGPYVDRAQKLKEYASDKDQDFAYDGMPQMRRLWDSKPLRNVLSSKSLKEAYIVSGKPPDWATEVLGLDTARNTLDPIIQDPPQKQVWSVLIHGPRGTGKSLLTKAIPTKFKEQSVFYVRTRRFVTESSGMDPTALTKSLISNFRKHTTGVLVLDDFDALYDPAAGFDEESKARAQAVKLGLEAGIKEISEKKQPHNIVIGVTCKPWLLEGSSKLFQANLACPLPDETEKTAILKTLISSLRTTNLGDAEIGETVKMTHLDSRYNLYRLVRFAVARAFKNYEDCPMREDAERLPHTSKEDFEYVRKLIIMENNVEDLKKFEEFCKTATPEVNNPPNADAGSPPPAAETPAAPAPEGGAAPAAPPAPAK